MAAPSAATGTPPSIQSHAVYSAYRRSASLGESMPTTTAPPKAPSATSASIVSSTRHCIPKAEVPRSNRFWPSNMYSTG